MSTRARLPARGLSWRSLTVVGVCFLGFLALVPNFVPRSTLDALPSWLPGNQIVLGLDLQGGSYLLLEVELAPVFRERMETGLADLRGALRGARVGYRNLAVQGETIGLTLTDPTQRERALSEIDKLNPSVLTAAGGRVRDFEVAEEEGGRISLRLTAAKRTELAQSAVNQSLEVVRRRIDELGTREASIQRQGADRILVQVPGERNPENIKRLLGRTARLTFHMVDTEGSLADARQGRVPPGSMLLDAAEGEGGDQYLVRRQVEVSGENLVDAQPSFQENQPVVSFRFDNTGARRFGRITQDNVGKPFAIVLDDKVISAPRIREPILGGSGIISGSFTVESATELAVLLRAGALPAPLAVIEERSVGAELGADSIRGGTIACLVAGVLVVGFIVFYYGVFGAIASLALFVNLVLILAIMTLLGATLTLPGIAGIVLTIGQAVDSNVLIYERVREEMRAGRTPLSSINTGFGEALRTIVDANLTALIAALALFQFGSGPVKGFAVTLGLGVITNMFTATYFSRFLVGLWYDRTRPSALPL